MDFFQQNLKCPFQVLQMCHSACVGDFTIFTQVFTFQTEFSSFFSGTLEDYSSDDYLKNFKRIGSLTDSGNEVHLSWGSCPHEAWSLWSLSLSGADHGAVEVESELELVSWLEELGWMGGFSAAAGT